MGMDEIIEGRNVDRKQNVEFRIFFGFCLNLKFLNFWYYVVFQILSIKKLCIQLSFLFTCLFKFFYIVFN